MGKVLQFCNCETLQLEELARARKRLHEQDLEIERLSNTLKSLLGKRR